LQFNPANVPPSIQHTEINDIFNNEPTVLTAQIVDDGTITEANLFYRTTFNGTTSNWNLVTGTTSGNNLYEFSIPGFQHLTEVEYYIAAQDDSDSISTLPAGGSGINPGGNIPPSEFFSYSVVITGPPIFHSFLPLGDTTVVVNSEFDFLVNVEDTTGLILQYTWKKNGLITTDHDSIYHYRANVFAPLLPMTDSITAIISNGYFSVTKTWYVLVTAATDVKDNEQLLTYNLEQNYPNPFNPTTQISFSIPKNEFVNLSIYNLVGEKVAELFNENLSAGKYDIKFDAGNLTSGIYFARISAGNFDKLIKMTLLK
jgi:hypothetical protein